MQTIQAPSLRSSKAPSPQSKWPTDLALQVIALLHQALERLLNTLSMMGLLKKFLQRARVDSEVQAQLVPKPTIIKQVQALSVKVRSLSRMAKAELELSAMLQTSKVLDKESYKQLWEVASLLQPVITNMCLNCTCVVTHLQNPNGKTDRQVLLNKWMNPRLSDFPSFS